MSDKCLCYEILNSLVVEIKKPQYILKLPIKMSRVNMEIT